MRWDEVPSHVIYRQVRENVIGLLTARPDAAGRWVPACPEWTVRDLVSHLVDICARVTGWLTGQAPEPRGAHAAHAAHAARGGDPGLAHLLTEWAEAGERLDRLIAEAAHPRSRVLAMDTFTHELDLRYALELPPPAGHPGYPSMLGVVVGGFSGQVIARGLPPLRIELPGAHWTAGQDEPPVATMRAPGPHDLYRTLTGRRTHAQIKALSWSADPAPWQPAFAWGPFSPPPRPAEEPAGC
jgi:uncharacterized protein (TIGR03083 family)